MRDLLTAGQLKSKLDDGEPWVDVADLACYGVQGEALQLKPWQEPPSVADENDPDERDKEAQVLLQLMLKAGLSRYEPDPMAALARERKPKRRNAPKPQR